MSDYSEWMREDLINRINRLTREIDEAKTSNETTDAKADRYERALQEIDNWARAYPLDIFPEPDFRRVREILEANGITLDSVSASSMRHVIRGVERIVSEALGGNVLKRRHVVKIEVQADDWDSMIRSLNNIVFDLSTHEPGKVRIISGGPDSGYTVNDEYYPDQTHDHYFEQIDAWLETVKQGGEE